jgi:DNA replication licensing factor MCM6
MGHLEQIDPAMVSYEPGDLRNVIESKYMMVRDALNAAVPELLAKLDDPEIEEEARKAREKDELKFTAAFYDLPLFSGIRDLRTEKLGRLVTICGTVTRMTEVKPELLIGTFQCNECSREVSGVEQQFKVTMPAVCPSRNCGNRQNWTLLAESRTTRWGDWQRIRLQENENEVPAGSMPRSMDVIVRDECVDRCKPGDKVLITGSLLLCQTSNNDESSGAETTGAEIFEHTVGWQWCRRRAEGPKRSWQSGLDVQTRLLRNFC